VPDPQRRRYNHPEAFCLMRYTAIEGDGLLIVWNSRDGVTPFGFFHEGKEYRHVEWNRDRCVPEHKLYPGDLYFRTITMNDARVFAERQAKRAWAEDLYECRDRWASEAAMAADLAPGIYHGGNAPMLDVYRDPTEVS
jgi:hypothetical protein